MFLCTHLNQRQPQSLGCGKLLQQIFGIMLIVLLLAGCGTQVAPTATPIPLTAATVIATSGDQEWDLVVIGDSTMIGIVDHYPPLLEQDLAIKVRIHNWTNSEQRVSVILKELRTNEELRQDLREAEVVLFMVNRGDAYQLPVMDYYLYGPTSDRCGGADNQDCLREALKLFEEDVDAVFAEIVSLCSPSDTLIRTMDAHAFWKVTESKENGTFEGLNHYWQAGNDYLIQVATEYHIPVAPVHEAFNGPNGDEDPRDTGYISSDAVHPTVKGWELMAKLYRDLGYEYAPQQP